MRSGFLKSRVRRRKASPPCAARRRGFTLVEMLVAVGLVMLMMVMFAQIFQIATGSLSVQKGLAENDQRARMATTLIKADLDKRTMEIVLAFGPNEHQNPPDENEPEDFRRRNFERRRGYFYISENNPNIDADVLQFTIDAANVRKNRDVTPLFGRALLLANLQDNPNQPEFDDLDGFANDNGQSSLAEVSYFLRNNTLYRRVILLRQPYDGDPDKVQPQRGPAGDGADFFDPDPNANSYGGSFWGHFDYSAHFSRAEGPRFHGAASLANDGSGDYPLGMPTYRFGHDHVDGRPREFVLDVDGNPRFLGRFTHRETSDPRFVYPSVLDAARNEYEFDNPMLDPMRRPDLTISNFDGVVDQYNGGFRIGEDILLTNVLGFDVKVWDNELGHFEDVGHSRQTSNGQPRGHYNQDNNLNTDYGALPGDNRVFDTWHPEFSFPSGLAPNDPPFRPEETLIVNGQPVSMPVPLGAIQITITYRDVASSQVRVLTIVQSLVVE